MINKPFIITIAFLIFVLNLNAQETGYLIDPRDGKSYKTIVLGNQTWMAENLNYANANSWCYDNDSINCIKYGRLYLFDTALNACPIGWHLPTDLESQFLITFLGGSAKAANELKAGGSSGFNALLAGYRSTDNKFYDSEYLCEFWTATPSSNSEAWDRFMYESYDKIYRVLTPCAYGYSVRCLKD